MLLILPATVIYADELCALTTQDDRLDAKCTDYTVKEEYACEGPWLACMLPIRRPVLAPGK